MRRLILTLSIITTFALLTACSSAEPTLNPLDGGILATFETPEGTFRAFITNDSTIQELFRVQSGESAATIPNGPLLPGAGAGEHNAPWSWHLDPEETSMAEVTIELCDGTAQFVENELAYWLETVRQYCPWGAELVDITDYR